MENKFIINDVKIENNTFIYDYEIKGEWIKYFNLDEPFFVNYSQKIQGGVPSSLAVIPLVCNVLPLAALFNGKIIVNSLERNFYNCIEPLMKSLKEMWENCNESWHFEYKNLVCVEKIEDLNQNQKELSNVLYFSGGVDAYSSLIRHECENLKIVTVIGADLSYKNEKGADNIIAKNREIARMHNVDMIIIKSSLRHFIKDAEISAYLSPLIHDNFWHGFQHGIGMWGLLAGILVEFNIDKVFFASSFSSKDDAKIRCGSDPSIDEWFKIGRAHVVHDGYELSRQDKISNICSYSKKNNKKIGLRVCYRSVIGDNCCRCEKCIRTIIGLLAENVNPIDYGFDNYSLEDFGVSFAQMTKSIKSYDLLIERLKEPQSKLKLLYQTKEIPKALRLFINSDIEEFCYFMSLRDSVDKDIRTDVMLSSKIQEKTGIYKDFMNAIFSENQEMYTAICKKILVECSTRPKVKKSFWIGNGGLMIDSNYSICKENNQLIINANKEKITISGWAIDFIGKGQPLADCFMKMGNKYYNLKYGKQNSNLAISFKNCNLTNCAFQNTIKLDEFYGNNELFFYMIGYQDGEKYMYPPIRYNFCIK